MCRRVAVWTRLILAFVAIVAVLLAVVLAGQSGSQSQAQGTIQTIILRRGENGYTGCEDTYISQYPPEANYCGVETLKVGYWQQFAGLIRFDLGSIPAHAVVTEAKLQLYATTWSGRDITIGAYYVVRDVNMCEATWTQAQADNAWESPGANDTLTDRRPVPESTVTTSSIRKWYELDLTEIVQGWVNRSLQNNGVLLLAERSVAAFSFASSNNYPIHERPALLINYYTDAPPPSATPPPEGEVVYILQQGVDGYTGCNDTRISEAMPEQNFAQGELILGERGKIGSLIRFDLSPVPSYAKVLEATLGLHVSNADRHPSESAIIGAYTVRRRWEETEATWLKARNVDYWGLPGCDDTTTDRSSQPMSSQAMYDLGWYQWDVTSAVQNWLRNAASNNGILLKQTNPEVGGEYDIRQSEYPGAELRPYLIVRCVLVTPTPTNTLTPTPTNTPTRTPTPTPTCTPTPTPAMAYLPKVLKNYPLRCVEWEHSFREEFENPALAGWSVSLAGGQQQVSDSVLRVWTQPSIDRFPMIWRNDVFAGAGDDFLFEARFRHSDFTAYGTTIALNSASFDGNRISAGQSLPPGIEDMLNIHHVVDHTGGVFRFDITMFKDHPNGVVWSGTPGDTTWHVVRITLEKGNTYTLHVDEKRIGTVKSSVRPSSVYIGNPTIQPFFGRWTQLYVDYIRISHCAVWG